MSTIVPNRLVLDIELAKPLPMLKGTKPDWNRAPECGISVMGYWRTGEPSPGFSILDSDMFRSEASEPLPDPKPGIVTWNGAGFDLPLINHHRKDWEYMLFKHVDLMVVCAALASGLPPSLLIEGTPADWKKRWPRVTFRGWSLNNAAQQTLGIAKSGTGAKAPIDWQNGKFARVANYCMRDVAILRELYRHAAQRGYLVGPTTVSVPPEVL